MFGSIFRKAQATVDNAIGQVVRVVIVATPLLVATGFGTAALLRYLEKEFGTDTAYLMMAGGFALISLVAMLVLSMRQRPAETSTEPEVGEATADASPDEQLGTMSSMDRDLLMSALATAGPYALPGLMRQVLRNLPLILAILAAVFVMTRPTDADAASPELAPAE